MLEGHLSHTISVWIIGLCKPTKSTEELDYEDDTPFDEEDEEDEEEETDNTDTDEPQILSHGMSVRVKAGSTVVLPCEVVHTGL